MNTNPVIQFENVSIAFDNTTALEDVNFTVSPNDLVCMVGPNGGGKTTLLKLILGILHPDSGSVSVFGDSPEKARPRIGYMPQHLSYDTRFPITVMNIVLMGRLKREGISGLFGWNGKADYDAAHSALNKVGMDGFANKSFDGLSGGQQQRVLIARAIASEPDLILLDEPTANVDAQVQEDFFTILRELNTHMTIIMVSHDLGFVSKIVKSVICVNQQVVFHPTSEITGEIIQNIYNCGLHMVRHDHRCSEKGHIHD